MPKARFIGDPSQREHRVATEFMGVAMPIGEWVDMHFAGARKLSANAHFEVEGLGDLVEFQASGPTSELEKLRAEFESLAEDRLELIAAYRERGEQLEAAGLRVAELEAQIAALSKPAEGESNGNDGAGTGKAGVAKAESAGRGANGRTRGSADS